MAKGHDESSAHAICTTSFQKAGNPIYEDRAAEAGDPESMRSLVLRAATGPVRTEMYGNPPREHFVVPVVACMEGVIHAVNARTPEFVPLETLKKAAATWEGKPVTLGHPAKDGRQCSASFPEILASYGIGTIRNSRVEGKKLLQEALIDKARAKALHPKMLERLEAGETDEVSIGAFVVTDSVANVYNDKPYLGSWLAAVGDHLAFLPDGRGACSRDMGCGTHRAAMRVCEDHLEVEADDELTFAAKYLSDILEARTAAGARHSKGDVELIQAIHDHTATLGASCEKVMKTASVAKRLEAGDVVHNVYTDKGERLSLRVASVKEHPSKNPHLYKIVFDGGLKGTTLVDKTNTYTVSRGKDEFTIRASLANSLGFAEKRH